MFQKVINRRKAFICTFTCLLVMTRILYSYSDHYQTDDRAKRDPLVNYVENQFPPRVPTTNLKNDQELEALRIEQERIDKKYCGGPCRFINYIYVEEQETRAQMVVRQFAFTAGMINRTIVLPNVAASRLGACLPYDFKYYYDMEWATTNKKFFNYITMTDFKAWLTERRKADMMVEEQVLSIHDQERFDSTNSREIIHCFSGYTVPRSLTNQVLAWNSTRQHAIYREQELLDFYRGPKMGDVYYNDDIEVLQLEIFKANPFSTLVPDVNIPIKYNSELTQFADITAQTLGSYIAVHWRMEEAFNASNLLNCAQHLIKLMQAKNLNTSKVFLLTDYPHTFTVAQQQAAIENKATEAELATWLQSTSESFLLEDFTVSHHQAIQYLYQHRQFNLFETTMGYAKLNTSKNWNLLPIPENLKRIHVVKSGAQLEMIDSGWLGILDKLVAIRSRHFFATRGDICGRGRSTFTAQIVNERKMIGKEYVHRFGRKELLPKKKKKTDDM